MKINLVRTKLAPNPHSRSLLRQHCGSWMFRHGTNILSRWKVILNMSDRGQDKSSKSENIDTLKKRGMYVDTVCYTNNEVRKPV